jgi:TP901 family phage tail tape measure protein
MMPSIGFDTVQDFAGNAAGAAEKVNKAFSGTAGVLGGPGVSIGALSAVKSTIDLDHRMVRLGLTANASAGEVNELKRRIFETAQMPDIKLDTGSIISGLEVVLSKVGDLRFVQDNARDIALAIQASGEEGAAMGAVFSEFAKFGYTMEEILPLMDDLIAQGDQGAFTFGEFAKNAPAVFSAYSTIGTTPEHIRKANAAMQILMAGTKSADIAVTALNHTMAELSDPDKQKKLRMLGIAVRDNRGNFRDFNDIMFDIVAKAEEFGNADFFGTIFGTTSMNAIRAYMTQGERMYSGLVNLGDTGGLLQQKSAAMADTLKSNLRNLQTAFLSFADKNLTGPLQDLTNLLNKLVENPERIEAWMRSIARGVTILAGVKIGAGIVSFLANLKSLQGGAAPDLSGFAKGGGGAGIPVQVTNWGGAASQPAVTGNAGLPGMPGAQSRGGLVDQYGYPLVPNKPAASPPPGQPASKWNLNKPNWKAAAGSAGISAAITAGLTLPAMVRELNEISKREDVTEEEKGKVTGGAVGETVGAISGTAAGALAGAAIGSVVPVVGTALGAIVGGLIGQFGGPVGRTIGEKIGEAARRKETGRKETWTPPKPATNKPWRKRRTWSAKQRRKSRGRGKN